MHIKIFVLTIVAFLTLLSCSQKVSNHVDENIPGASSKPSGVVNQNIPFTPGKNYFVRNDYKKEEHANPKITSKQEFDKVFGAAPFMGEKGKPTAIDFSKQYVLSVIGELTDRNTEIGLVSLQQTGNTIVINYKITEGEKMLMTMQPMLLLVVDNKYQGEVKLVKH